MAAYKGAYNFGFSKPYIAKYNYNEETGKISYSDGFLVGEGVNTTVTPNYANAALYGDNVKVDEVNEFSGAAIALGVTRMPLVASNVLFGHKIDDTIDHTETSNANDTPNFVGYGFTTKNTDGTYDACVLYKCKFVEGEDAFTTKGDSIAFKQPTLSGSAFANDQTKDWRKKKFGFTSEEDAHAWVKEILSSETTSAPSSEE